MFSQLLPNCLFCSTLCQVIPQNPSISYHSLESGIFFYFIYHYTEANQLFFSSICCSSSQFFILFNYLYNIFYFSLLLLELIFYWLLLLLLTLLSPRFFALFWMSFHSFLSVFRFHTRISWLELSIDCTLYVSST